MNIVIVEDSGNYQEEEPDWIVINKKTGEKDFVTAWSEPAALFRSKFNGMRKDEVEIVPDEGSEDEKGEADDEYEVCDDEEFYPTDEMLSSFDEPPPDKGEFTEEQANELESLRRKIIGDIRFKYIEAEMDVFNKDDLSIQEIMSGIYQNIDRAVELMKVAYMSDHKEYSHQMEVWSHAQTLLKDAFENINFIERLDDAEHVANMLDNEL